MRSLQAGRTFGSRCTGSVNRVFLRSIPNLSSLLRSFLVPRRTDCKASNSFFEWCMCPIRGRYVGVGGRYSPRGADANFLSGGQRAGGAASGDARAAAEDGRLAAPGDAQLVEDVAE